MIYYGKTEKQLCRINNKELKTIAIKISALKTNPRPANAIKLINSADYYRLRIGDCRAIYQINDKEKEIYIVAVNHRSEVYKKFK